MVIKWDNEVSKIKKKEKINKPIVFYCGSVINEN